MRYNNQIHELTYDGNRRSFVVKAAASLRFPSRVQIARIGPTASTSAAGEAKVFEDAYSEASRRLIEGHTLQLLSLNQSDAITTIDRDAEARLAISSGHERIGLPAGVRPEVYPIPQILRTQGRLDATVPGWSLRETRSPYEQPITDSNGLEVGTFTPTKINTSSVMDWLSKKTAAYLRLESGYTLDAISVAGRSNAYLLSTNVWGDTRLTYMSPEITIEDTCRSGRSDRIGREIKWEVETIHSADSRQISVNKFSGNVKPNGLVIYYHGGPAKSFRDGGYTQTVRRYYDLGFDVIVIDGAGSRDSGLLSVENLRTDAIYAIESDAEAVTAYVKGLSPKYINTIVHGESFGAAQAIVTADKMNADALILIVPWLKHRSPETLFSGPRSAALTKSQVAWETAVFGLRTSTPSITFREWLSSLTVNIPMGSNSLILFAQNDARSKLEDVTPGSAAVFVVPDSNHDRITSSDAAWELVASHLDKLGLTSPNQSSSTRR